MGVKLTYLALYQNIFYSGMAHSNASITSKYTKKYTHLSPLWPKEEVPQLGGWKHVLTMSFLS